MTGEPTEKPNLHIHLCHDAVTGKYWLKIVEWEMNISFDKYNAVRGTEARKWEKDLATSTANAYKLLYGASFNVIVKAVNYNG